MEHSSVIIILILHLCVSVYSIQPCCDGENIMKNRHCANGSKPNKPCDNVYLTHSIKLVQTLEDDEYCVTRFEGKENDSYLVCFPTDLPRDWKFDLYPILELSSVGFILITVIIYSLLPKLLDIQGIITMHSISGLAIAYIFLAANQLGAITGSFCTTIAFIIYFACFYAFCWLNLLAFHVWRTTIEPKIFDPIKRWQTMYHFYGIGLPVIFLIGIIIMHQTSLSPGFGEGSCWFNASEAEIQFFYIPISILFGLNIMYFAWTVMVLWKDISKCDDKKIKILKFRIKMCMKLFIIMGVPWIFEAISGVFRDAHFVVQIWWVIMDCINALQGLLIFLVLVVFRKKVIRELANKTVCGKRFPNHWKTLQDDECEDLTEEYNMNNTLKV